MVMDEWMETLTDGFTDEEISEHLNVTCFFFKGQTVYHSRVVVWTALIDALWTQRLYLTHVILKESCAHADMLLPQYVWCAGETETWHEPLTFLRVSYSPGSVYYLQSTTHMSVTWAVPLNRNYVHISPRVRAGCWWRNSIIYLSVVFLFHMFQI